jgi:hypothetical protein
MKVLGFLLASALALAVLPIPAAEACSCLPGSMPDTLCKGYASSGQVFAGRVLDITPHPTTAYHYNILFAVDEAFKGTTAGSQVTVVSTQSSGLCGVQFVLGEAYLFLGTSICSGGRYTKRLSLAGTDLATLRAGTCNSTPGKPISVTAQDGTIGCDGTAAIPIVLDWAPADVSSWNVRKYVSGSNPVLVATNLTTNRFSHYTTQNGTYFVSALRGTNEGPNSNGVTGRAFQAGCPRPTPTVTATTTPTATARARVRVTPTSRPRPTPTSSGTPAWQAGRSYSTGALVTYGGMTYRCVQGHTSQVGWEPPNTPALWSVQ